MVIWDLTEESVGVQDYWVFSLDYFINGPKIFNLLGGPICLFDWIGVLKGDVQGSRSPSVSVPQ
jgi:hypothetical protein